MPKKKEIKKIKEKPKKEKKLKQVLEKESELEKEIEEDELTQTSEFVESPIILEKFNPTLQQTESVQVQTIPLEEQAEEFILPQDKKSEKKDYATKEPVDYGETISHQKDYDLSTNSSIVNSSRLDYEDLGRETESRPTIGLHQEFERKEDKDYTAREQRFERPESPVLFQKKKSEYHTR